MVLGDGYGFEQGNYLITKFSAELVGSSFKMTIEESGSFPRAKVPLKIRLFVKDQPEYAHKAMNDGNTITFNYHKAWGEEG